MISISLAAYNGEKYIREQIDSILAQTYQDFELIVCDDCSTDSTWGIIQEYEQQDGRIHGYRNDENIGFKKNFEKAIGLCRGEYVALSDQDDVWTRDHLEVLLDNIGDKMLCCGDAELIDEAGRSMSCTLSEIEGDYSLLDTAAKKLIRILYAKNHYQGASMLLRRKALQTMLPIPEGVFYHDAWFAACASAFDSLLYVDRVITRYRQHGHNASGPKKIPLWRRVKGVFTKHAWKTDRLCYCDALLTRYGPNLNDEIRALIAACKEFHENRNRFLYRLKAAPFRIRNYRYMYLTKSKSPLFFCRIARFIFLTR